MTYILHVIDGAIPSDATVPQKEAKKVEKYSDLKRELQKNCHVILT